MPIQFDIKGAKKAGASDAEIADYLAQRSGFDIAGARKAGAVDVDIINHLASPVDLTMGDVERSARSAFGASETMGYGALALTGNAAEKVLGTGGNATKFKNWALGKAQASLKEDEPLQRDYDDVTVAWDRAKQGDVGALVDWAQSAVGSVLGSVGESAIAAGAGAVLGGVAGGTAGAGVGAAPGAVAGAVVGVAGKEGLKSAIKNRVLDMVRKKEAEYIAKGLAAEQATKEATKSVARTIGSVGGATALSMTQGTGQTYLSAKEEADRLGQELSGADLARVFATGVAQGGLDAASDVLGLGALTGKIKLPGAAGSSVVGRAATGFAATGAAEGATETAQQFLERVGAGKDLTSDEAIREYINAGATGFVGGGALGGAANLRKPATPSPAESLAKITAPDTSLDDAIAATDLMTRRTDELSAAIGDWKTQSEQALTSADPEVVPQQLDIFTGEAKDAVPAAPQQQVESEPMVFANPAQRDMLLETPTAMVQAGDAYTAQSLAQRIGMESGGVRSAYGARLALEMSRNMQGSMALLEQESAKLQANLDKLNAKLDSPKATLSEQDYLKQRAAIESQMRQVEAAKGISSQFNQYMTNSYAAEASGRSAQPTLTNNTTVADNSGTVEQMVEKNLRLREDASLADVDAKVQESMERQAQQTRESILNNVLSDTAVQDHAAKFQAELARAGVQDTAVRPEEANRIARFKEVNQTFTQPDVIPSAPNEFDPYGSAPRQAAQGVAPVDGQITGEQRNKFQNVAVDPETLPDASLQPGATTNELTKQSLAALKQMARLVGKRVEVFENASDKANDGYWDPKKPNTVFLNRKTTMPHMAVLFHEVMHALKNQNPQAYAAIAEVLKTRSKNAEGKTYKQYYGGKAQDLQQEMIADLTGNFAMEPDFWTDVFAEVERQNGAGAKSIITRLTATVTRVVRELVSRMSNKQGFATQEWVENLQEVRQAITSAMAQYVAQQRTNMETETAPAAPASKYEKLKGRKFKQTFKVQGSDKQVTMEYEADKMLEQLDERQSALEKLKTCLGG